MTILRRFVHPDVPYAELTSAILDTTTTLIILDEEIKGPKCVFVIDHPNYSFTHQYKPGDPRFNRWFERIAIDKWQEIPLNQTRRT